MYDPVIPNRAVDKLACIMQGLDEQAQSFVVRLLRAMQTVEMTDGDIAFLQAALRARNFKAADARLRRKLMRVAH